MSLWTQLITEAIGIVQRGHTCPPLPAAPDLATTILAAVRGGLLLAQASGDFGPLQHALRLALAQLPPRDQP